MVLDQGKIVEFNDPNTLLKDKSTVFYGMAKDADIVWSFENIIYIIYWPVIFREHCFQLQLRLLRFILFTICFCNYETWQY